MELRAYKPQLTDSRTFDAKEVRVIPIGDIQYQNDFWTDVPRLKRYLRWGLDNECYFLGMGDFIDAGSPSERAALLTIRGTLHDSTRNLLETAVRDIIDELMDILEESKGSWLGMLRGHHSFEFEDATIPEDIIAQRLDTTVLGDCAMLAMDFGKRYKPAWIWCHHGAGGGLTPGVALNRLAHISRGFYADVYLMGHVHKTTAAPVPWMYGELQGANREAHLEGSKRYLMSVGGFLKGYAEGSTDPTGRPAGSYVEKAMMTPNALGTAVIKFRPIKGRVDTGVEFL